jgi:hypothetical protein
LPDPLGRSRDRPAFNHADENLQFIGSGFHVGPLSIDVHNTDTQFYCAGQLQQTRMQRIAGTARIPA